jgi:hypothetical protein
MHARTHTFAHAFALTHSHSNKRFAHTHTYTHVDLCLVASNRNERHLLQFGCADAHARTKVREQAHNNACLETFLMLSRVCCLYLGRSLKDFCACILDVLPIDSRIDGICKLVGQHYPLRRTWADKLWQIVFNFTQIITDSIVV